MMCKKFMIRNGLSLIQIKTCYYMIDWFFFLKKNGLKTKIFNFSI